METTQLELKVQNLYDAVAKMRKELDFTLSTLDSDNIREIITDEVEFRSLDGSTRIIGNLLKMTDTSIDRLVMGYNKSTGKFEFSMFDLLGNQTLSMNDDGEAVFSGNIETQKDIKIGNNVYIGDLTSNEEKGIYFYNDAGQQTSITQTIDSLNLLSFTNLNLTGNSISVSGSEIFLSSSDGDIIIDDLHGSISITSQSAQVILSSYGNFMIDVAGDGDILINTLYNKNVRIGSNNAAGLSFFGASPATQQTAALLSIVTSETADSTYSSNEVTMLNNLKSDVSSLAVKINGVITKLGYYGLFAVS